MADFEEDNSYLQPGFDPNSLTMPKLRNILFQHDIAYPSGAKKAQLVEVFESQLRPKAKRILAQQARVKRTSMGIQDMSSQSSVDGEIDPEPEPTPRRSTRKSSAAPSAASTRSRTSRRSTRTAATEDEETESIARSSRYSTATPGPETASESGTSLGVGRRKARLSDYDPTPPTQIKEELSGGEEVSTPKGSNPFTMDNPFQSGSSPAEEDITRRQSTIKKPARRRPASSSSNVHIKSEEDATPVPKVTKSRAPTARASNSKAKVSRSRTESLEPSEEFTKEEQEELDEEEEVSGQAIMPARKRPTDSSAKTGPLVILFTILLGVGGWWRQEKIAAGYCGIGSSGQSISLSNSGVSLPEFLEFLQPQCEPCPQHAYCFSDFEARCDSDFVLQNHPLSLGGLIPLPPSCEPDSEKAKKVKSVGNRAVDVLREQRASYECGSTDADGKTVTTPGLTEETLKAKVSERRRHGMTEAEFEELWRGAIGDILERDEVTKEKDGSSRRIKSGGDANGDPLLASSSLARLPLSCAVRRSARLALARHRVPLALVILALAGLAYLRRRITRSRSDRARIPGLVTTALDRLATQAALHEYGRASEPYISMAGLRDDLLREEFSAARRDDIWRRVQAVTELNANVRAGVREARSGDVSRVWEWIGPLPVLDDGGYSSSGGYDSRRQSGRFSFGGATVGRNEESFLSSDSSPAGATTTTTTGRVSLSGAGGGSKSWFGVKKEKEGARSTSPAVNGGAVSNGGASASTDRNARKWDEGRAVY